jgi:hypothetical protein
MAEEADNMERDTAESHGKSLAEVFLHLWSMGSIVVVMIGKCAVAECTR